MKASFAMTARTAWRKTPSASSIANRHPASLLRITPRAAVKSFARNAPANFCNCRIFLEDIEFPFQVNHRLVRGLDYYTRTVFEIQPEVEGGQSSLGGGGRYDGLIEQLGGKPTPGIGFGIGIERVIINLKKENISVPLPAPTQVYIAYMGDPARDEAFRLTAGLRRAGISAVCAAGGKSLKAQLRQANTLGAVYAAIIGEDEVKAGTVTLRKMADAVQETVKAGDLAGRIASSGK